MSDLSGLFTTILNMSITATYVAAGVILVRLFLRKAPKIFSYALWTVVLFRLICPLSFTSAVSFLGLLNINPQNAAGVLEYVPHNIGFMPEPTVQSGIGSLDSAVNSSLPAAAPIASVNPMQIWIDVLSLIWLAGIIILILYSVLSYVKIKRQLMTATLVKDNIYESDQIGTAFVCGFVHPKIYVPLGVADADLSYILEHERTHIRRRDYLIKPLAFFAIILHWFNPIMWLSFALMSRDMEMSCDESVLHKMNPEAKGGYSSSLLALSVKRSGLFAANPLAFGEGHVKARIKNVLNYKKPRFWAIVLAVIATAVLVVVFTANPKHGQPVPDSYWGYSIDALMDNKTPYVGNSVKVIGLIDAMPLPAGIVRDKVELQTDQLPYGITINYIINDSSVLVNGAIGEAFYRNNILLFSLIDNVDVINCKIIDETGEYDGASFVLPREMAEVVVGGDVRSYAGSADSLRDLIDLMNNAALGANVEVKPMNSEKLLCSIEAYDEKTRMLTFDEIEWVTIEDTKRISELGLDANLDFPNPYYIYNESDQTITLKVSENVKVYLVNWHDLANHTLTDVNGLAERTAEKQVPYHLTIKDGVIVEILEQYTP